MFIKLLTPVFLLAFLISTPAQAEENKDLVSVSAGYYDINDNEEAADFRLEYRWGTPLFWEIKPFAGLEATSDGAMYGLGGLLIDFDVADSIIITPSFGAGAYSDGSGKDLGHTVEFRSMIEVGYEFENESRASIGFSHISNASLDDNNPGTEVLSLYYHFPVN